MYLVLESRTILASGVSKEVALAFTLIHSSM